MPDPYFNEPGYQSSQGKAHGKNSSDRYNAQIRIYTTSAGIMPFLQVNNNDKEQAYPEFSDPIAKHFELKRYVMQQQLNQWTRDDKTGGMSKL